MQDSSRPLNEWFAPGVVPGDHHFPVIQIKPQDVSPAFPSRPDTPAAVFGQRVCISVYNNKTISRSFPWRWNLVQDKVIKISMLHSVLVFRG